jgi:polyhydroxyalkanoate synthesis regulator protein
MAVFNQALAMFTPFVNPVTQATPATPPPASSETQAEPEPDPKNDLEEMKRQLIEMQRRIEGLVLKEEPKDPDRTDKPE